MGHQRSVAFPTQEKPFAPRNDEQTAIGQPINAEWQTKRGPDNNLAVAVEIDCDDLLGSPVREPKTVLVPTW